MHFLPRGFVVNSLREKTHFTTAECDKNENVQENSWQTLYTVFRLYEYIWPDELDTLSSVAASASLSIVAD
jgi:hypothetical protein